MGKVIAVCTSERKGIEKTSVPEIKVIEDWGIEGDAHAGKWHRQVSLLSFDKIEDFRARGAEVEDTLGKKLKDIEVDMKGNIRKYPVHITPITEYHYTHPKYNIFIRIEYVRLFCLISLLIVLGAL